MFWKSYDMANRIPAEYDSGTTKEYKKRVQLISGNRNSKIVAGNKLVAKYKIIVEKDKK